MKTTRNELKLRADKCPIKRFKAFIGKANTQATLCADTGIEIIGWSGFDASDLNAKSHRVELARFIAATDPETILALLAELEAKDKRIAELEEEFAFIMGQNDGMDKELREKDARIEHLEAKLATLVRLPHPACTYADHSYPAYSRKQVEEIITSAGMCFTIEGDE